MPPLILIVDDDNDLGTVLQELLETLGYRAGVATDVAAALARLQEEQPALVILDWIMPGGDPADVARLCAARGIPVVLSSAGPDSRGYGQAIGAAATLPKPFDIHGLEMLLARLLGPRDGVRPGYS
jgi:DNA-binding response OmpR family regulator